jgi:MscS family membrane protein
LVVLLSCSSCPGAQPERAALATNSAAAALSTNSPLVDHGTNVEHAGSAAHKKSTLLDEQVTFGLDRIEFLQFELLGNPLWKYIASLLYIALAFYLSKLLDYLFQVWLKTISAKTELKIDRLLIELFRGPVKVICFVVLLHVGMNLFSWPPWISKYLSQGLTLVVAASLTYLALKCIDWVMKYWRYRAASDADRSFNEHLYAVVSKSVKIFVIVVAVLLTSQNLGLNITSVLASLSIGALAVGLAAQDTLANLFGAIAVFLDKPFQIGDRIKLDGGVDGVVESIGLRSTRVRHQDGYLITVPNKTMGNATITNIARRPTLKTDINLALSYDTTSAQLQRALEILREVYGGHPMTKDFSVSFTKFGESALNIQVSHTWKNTDYDAYQAGMEALNLTIKQRFDTEGLKFAFPSRTLYVKQDSTWRAGNGDAQADPGRKPETTRVS